MSEETFVETYWRARADRNAKEAERYKAMADELAAALKIADQFITNGIEFGRISMPDPDCPDPAHDTPEIIRDALAKYDAMKGEE